MAFLFGVFGVTSAVISSLLVLLPTTMRYAIKLVISTLCHPIVNLSGGCW